MKFFVVAIIAIISITPAQAQNDLQQMMNNLSPDANLPSAAQTVPRYSAPNTVNGMPGPPPNIFPGSGPPYGQRFAGIGPQYAQPNMLIPGTQNSAVGRGSFGQTGAMNNIFGPRPNNANPLQALFGGGQQTPQVQQPIDNPFSLRGMLRSFMGGTNVPAGAVGDGQALSVAQENLQTALDQAAQAEDACGRASYGEKDMRLSAAEEARNHASEARACADRASSAAYGHGGSAGDVASQTRAAADRAQAAADRATYNASSN